MRRFVDPALIVFSICLFASLAVHLPIYGALGWLKKLLELEELQETAQAGETIEFDVQESEEEPPATEEPAEAEAPDPDRERRPDRRERERAVVVPEPPPAVEEPEREVTKRPPQRFENLQAVQQRSQDPTVETPEDARFAAAENNRVEEETAARLRNYNRDDPEPTPGRQQRPSPDEEEGNADEEQTADMREMEGHEARSPTVQETEMERPREADDTPPPPQMAEGDTAPEGEEGRESQEEQAAAEREEAGGGETEEVVINDRYGTLRLRPRARGEGEGDDGGVRRPGARQPREARERRGHQGRGRGFTPHGPDRPMAWSELQAMVGEEELEQQREAYVRERRSKQRGRARQRSWEEFRAAIENFTPTVRPGNQTALNTAASPFAEYIAAVHRRIHREFADRFLAGLPTWSTHPFADTSLMTELEIILNRDGTVHRIGVVQTSGFLPYDYGAFNAVMRAQPYPEPPLAILSGDSRVYFHWGFFRNERQCGTFNAEPYILPNPPNTPAPGGGPLQDRPEEGGVIPRDATPTWGTQPRGGDDSGDEPGDAPAPSDAPRPPAGDDEGAPPREDPTPGPRRPPTRPTTPPADDAPGDGVIG